MKTSLLCRLGGALLALVSLTAVAQTRVAAPPRPEASKGGLQVTLTTGGYKFLVNPAPTALAHGDTILPGEPAPPIPAPDASRDFFPASAVLVNRSNSDITFTFPNPAAAERRFTFRLLDSAGAEVWSSEEDAVAAQVITEARLARRSSWRQLVQVPLKTDGQPLPPGFYTLQAFVEADKEVGATAVIEVALRQPATPDPRLMGIRGLVSRVTGPPDPLTGVIPSVAVAGARVVVRELRPNNTPTLRAPFTWEGRTDAEGRFTTNTPAGRFQVTTTIPGSVGLNRPAAGAAQVSVIDVTVEPGRFSDVPIVFVSAGPPPVPVANTGIKGLVLIGPIRPVDVIGQPNEAPLAGALVRIEEIRLPNARYDRPAFTWSGISNAEGRFQVTTPAGRFRVTALQALVVDVRDSLSPGTVFPGFRQGSPYVHDLEAGSIIRVNQATPPVGYTGYASVEVSVAAGTFSEVTLYLDTGIR